ncbi:unnamed protein product, partial [Pylaiella littoralis]
GGTSGSGGSSRSFRPPSRCWRCNHQGHHRVTCTTKPSDFLVMCTKCSGFGHKTDDCI